MPLDEAIENRIRGEPLSAHLATSVDGRPHVAPVWYAYREGALYALTGGKKLANARRNPRVAVSIEKGDGEGRVEWGATLLGRVTVVEDPERIADAETWVYDAYEAHETGDDGDAEFDPGEPGVDYALLEIEVGSATLRDY